MAVLPAAAAAAAAAICLLLTGGEALAADNDSLPPPTASMTLAGERSSSLLWAVGLAGQVDSASGSSMLATVNLGLSDRTWLSFGAGRSRSGADRADVAVRTFNAGLDHRFGVVGVIVHAGLWGDPDALESTEYRGGPYLQFERLRIGYEREHRDLQLRFTFAGPTGDSIARDLRMSATADALRARVQLADRWQMLLTTRRFDYSRDLAVLPRIAQLNLLSTSPLTLAYGFIESERSVAFEWQQGLRLFSFGASRDRSAVDGSRLQTAFAALLFPIALRVDMEVTVGHGRWGAAGGPLSAAPGSSHYAGVLFLIYGG